MKQNFFRRIDGKETGRTGAAQRAAAAKMNFFIERPAMGDAAIADDIKALRDAIEALQIRRQSVDNEIACAEMELAAAEAKATAANEAWTAAKEAWTAAEAARTSPPPSALDEYGDKVVDAIPQAMISLARKAFDSAAEALRIAENAERSALACFVYSQHVIEKTTLAQRVSTLISEESRLTHEISKLVHRQALLAAERAKNDLRISLQLCPPFS